MKSKRIKIAFFAIALVSSLNSFAQFRVIGYVHPRGESQLMEKIPFKGITHLNIAFVNPDSSGNLVLPGAFDSIIERAHFNKVKVLASIGGGSHNPYYASLLTDANRRSFIKKLVQMAAEHRLDGIDIDLENNNIDRNYPKLVAELSAAMKPQHKLLTAAVATWNGDSIPNAALKHFDFVNIMSYDETGPWRPEKPGPHATYEKAEFDLQYWTVTRKLKKEKVNLGLPFYGYCFGTQYGASMNYKDILINFPGAENKDEVNPETGGAIFYNGLPTIRKKTQLALKKAGGVMIWQILQDTSDEKLSLLREIGRVGRLGN